MRKMVAMATGLMGKFCRAILYSSEMVVERAATRGERCDAFASLSFVAVVLSVFKRVVVVVCVFD